MKLRFTLITPDGKEENLIARNYEEACGEVLKKFRLRIKQREIHPTNEPSLF